MFISIQIITNLTALFVLLWLFTYLLKFKYFKHKYTRLFMKVWIDLTFLSFIMSIVHISIPLQNRGLVNIIFFVAYFWLFYYIQKTSVWSFMYLYSKVKEKNNVWKTEKLKLEEKLKNRLKSWRKNMYIFLSLVVIFMLLFPGHQLNDWSFKKTEIDWYMVNSNWEILVDNEWDWNYYMGYFDKYWNDWIIDEVRYDFNKDNKVDLKQHIDGNGEEIENYIVDYSEQRWIMIFFAIIFFIFLFIKGYNNKNWWEQIIASILLLAIFSSLFWDYKEVKAVNLKEIQDEYNSMSEYELAENDCWQMWWCDEFDRLNSLKKTEVNSNSNANMEDINLDSINEQEVVEEEDYSNTDFGYYEDRLNYDPVDDNEALKEWTKELENNRKAIEKLERQNKAKQEQIRKQEEIKMEKEILKQKELIKDIESWLDSLENNNELNKLKEMIQDSKDQKLVNEIINPSTETLKQKEANKQTVDLINETLSNLKESSNISKEALNYLWGFVNEVSTRRLINIHWIKSKEITDRIKWFKDNIEKLKTSKNFGALWDIKANKAWIRWVGDYYDKAKQTFWKDMSKWSKAWKRLGTTLTTLWNIWKWLSVYWDYNDFNKEFNWDRSKTVAATTLQQWVWNLVWNNPIDYSMWLITSWVSLLWYTDVASRMWDFTLWWVAKNTIKDSLWSSFKDIGWVISVEMDRIKKSEWIIDTTWAVITWWITATYSLWVAAVKIPLEWVVAVTKWIWNAAVSVTNSIVNKVSWLFNWRSSRY